MVGAVYGPELYAGKTLTRLASIRSPQTLPKPRPCFLLQSQGSPTPRRRRRPPRRRRRRRSAAPTSGVGAGPSTAPCAPPCLSPPSTPTPGKGVLLRSSTAAVGYEEHGGLRRAAVVTCACRRCAAMVGCRQSEAQLIGQIKPDRMKFWGKRRLHLRSTARATSSQLWLRRSRGSVTLTPRGCSRGA